MPAHQDEIRRMREQRRRDPPEWKRKLLRQIDDLARQPGALELFRGHIRNVAKELHDAPRNNEGKNYKVFFGPGPALSLPQKVYLLAAFHDVFADAERMARIMEWNIDLTKERYWDVPEWRHCARYEGYGGQCADLTEEELQPAVLQRYVDEVKAEIGKTTLDMPKPKRKHDATAAKSPVEVKQDAKFETVTVDTTVEASPLAIKAKIETWRDHVIKTAESEYVVINPVDFDRDISGPLHALERKLNLENLVGPSGEIRELRTALATALAQYRDICAGRGLPPNLVSQEEFDRMGTMEQSRFMEKGGSTREFEVAKHLDRLERLSSDLCRVLATVAEAQAKGAQPNQDESQNIFRNDGHFWTVRFGRKTCLFKDSKGMAYIGYLVARPNKRVSALELYYQVSPHPPGAVKQAPDTTRDDDAGYQRGAKSCVSGVAANEVLGKGDYWDMKRQFDELQEEKRKAEADNDPLRMEQVQADILAMGEYMRKQVGPQGQRRKWPGSLEKARQTVTKAIRSAIRSMGKEHPALGKHLDVSLDCGRVLTYTPERNHDWQTG